MSDWKPIRTAPKDRPARLGYHNHVGSEAIWIVRHGYAWERHRWLPWIWVLDRYNTHWAELLPPPEDAQ